MTSNINPNDINGNYPVAGQDNNSQGFRDNFTNTATNFQYAADEITDLQNKAVLKAALTGTTLNNNMNGVVLSNAQLQQMTETVVALGTLTGSVTLNFASGSYQTLTTNGPVSIGFGNLPAAGVLGAITLQVTVVSTAHTITFPTAVTVNALGIQGLDTGTNVLTVAAVGTYSFTFSTSNGGSTINITEVNKELQPFNNSREVLNSSAAANLAVTTSYFSTVAPTTATLAAGVPGQIKVFSMLAQSGNMVITTANAGWKTSGTGNITFSAIGQGCTLQYTNSKWFCIGNNGATFS
jgi:hypothetical protein